MMNKIISLFIVILFVTSSCDPGMVYDHFEKIPDQQWEWKDIKTFSFDMQDSIESYNIYTNIRHTKDYPRSNLYLFVTIHAPDQNILRDTIELQIAKPNGQWIGSGFGDIRFVRSRFKTDVRFARKGEYVITVEHGMRMENIPVTDVGIRVEKYKSIN